MTDLETINQIIQGKLQGNPDYPIAGIQGIFEAGPNEITFFIKDQLPIEPILAGAIIVPLGFKSEYPNLIYVTDPYVAFAKLLHFFNPHQPFCQGIDPSARVAESAIISENVSVGHHSYIGDHCRIGANTEIHAQVTIYPHVSIGKNCLIYSNVVIREAAIIGDDVIIQPGAIIGADGFGFARDEQGNPLKIPQVGKVIIGNHCEIGANTCIDRSTLASTIISDQVKTDNLVQIGHNVIIGQGTTICAMCGIGGSTVLGKNVVLGGFVGIADHLTIADGVKVAAKTGVSNSVKQANQIISGYPHQEIGKWRKSQVIIRNLDDYVDRIKALESKLKELEAKIPVEPIT
jgi:UDP-3-O-[3-hydroxymyristoyl] glucosamine N-acyltransferase